MVVLADSLDLLVPAQVGVVVQVVLDKILLVLIHPILMVEMAA